MRGAFPLAILLSLLLTRTSAAEDPRLIAEFTSPDAAARWQTVNDSVMGGVSQGRFRVTAKGTLEFSGRISLDNNGGFASVRTRPGKLPLRDGDTIVIRLLGDGREYSLNLYTKRERIAFSYKAPVRTVKDQWVDVAVPLESFEANSFGQAVPDAGPPKAAEIGAIGLMLADRTSGPFRVEIERIDAMPSPE